MKIVEVRSKILFDRYHLVMVRTDEGVYGIGEASPAGAEVTHAVVKHMLAPLVLGEDAGDITRLWRKMYHHAYKIGPMGALLEAMAAIDIALWDIAGKAAGLPLYALLGGKVRDTVPLYASSLRRDLGPEGEAARALQFRDEGFHGYKIHSGTRWGYDQGPDRTVETIEAVRSAVGDDFPLMVDVNNAYLPHTAIRIARVLERLGVFHFEEPIAAHDYDGYAQLSQSVDIPIAAGEQEFTKWQFRDLIVRGQVDIIQPDVVKCGGITEFVKIASLAEAWNKPVTVHNTQPTIGTIAHAHLCAATPMCVYAQEYSIEPHPLRDDLGLFGKAPWIEKGSVRPPNGPGLGIDIDEDLFDRGESSQS